MRPSARQPRKEPLAARAAGVLLITAAVLASTGVCQRGYGATITITVHVTDGRPLPGAVIMVRPLDGQAHPAAPLHAVMDQVNRAFEPDLLVVPVGSTIEFPNSDSVSHQIYSFSPPKRFQLPLYRGKPYPPVRFDQAGVVTLGCNIHDEMLAYVLVTDAPLFGRTEASGSWSTDVPRGRYRVSIWHPRLRDDSADLERELTIGDADRASLTLRLSKPLEPAPLEGRPHSWDRY